MRIIPLFWIKTLNITIIVDNMAKKKGKKEEEKKQQEGQGAQQTQEKK
jgi:hypothetical protein